ncbi:MAG: hypothetical protein A2493_00440 [Candidatus Magasanikbacteria bacterium RIFOXYC12_FULL_33_11]|uniref:Uncharacterized protein n=1 Tax=Candidatus Magasanikbacteria bacterium RIFOXYC12_FULL_33_11 TaxID=1798701 RepID=A0A1F6NRP3_9BACT|nr:MAG: hypothetical protein A2493_00440 [Candidatus Magasanikbacteria bacterium RIFOXYC12_FULL_33_11]
MHRVFLKDLSTQVCTKLLHAYALIASDLDLLAQRVVHSDDRSSRRHPHGPASAKHEVPVVAKEHRRDLTSIEPETNRPTSPSYEVDVQVLEDEPVTLVVTRVGVLLGHGGRTLYENPINVQQEAILGGDHISTHLVKEADLAQSTRLHIVHLDDEARDAGGVVLHHIGLTGVVLEGHLPDRGLTDGVIATPRIALLVLAKCRLALVSKVASQRTDMWREHTEVVGARIIVVAVAIERATVIFTTRHTDRVVVKSELIATLVATTKLLHLAESLDAATCRLPNRVLHAETSTQAILIVVAGLDRLAGRLAIELDAETPLFACDLVTRRSDENQNVAAHFGDQRIDGGGGIEARAGIARSTSRILLLVVVVVDVSVTASSDDEQGQQGPHELPHSRPPSMKTQNKFRLKNFLV